jgi:hydroxymethylglutaryl-CoA reductase
MEIRETGPGAPGAYQLFVTFRTADAMGANFINSVLEALAAELPSLAASGPGAEQVEVVMAILSNYTPECLVECHVETEVDRFESLVKGMPGSEFVSKFLRAVDIALADPYRAVTHNKGIFNGMDAVLLATGNDYRAVEACGHAYAAREGNYRSLSRASLNGKTFSLDLEIPLAVGTVGGLTASHPLASVAMEILGKPSAEKLMMIIAAAGMANNFSAVRSLVTTGIQHGHMKMHLGNILRQLHASPSEAAQARGYFSERTVSHAAVVSFLETLRNPSSR